MKLRLLVVEGNTRAGREAYVEGFGFMPHQSYAQAVAELAPGASFDFAFPADADAALPGGASLADYDGVFLTGSALNIYDGGPEIARQIELARAVFASGTPMFGSCWGIQVGGVAAGGEVVRNPRGREIGIARDIRVTEAGRAHPLLAGRPETFGALCSHLDHVATPPPGGKVLAGNAMSEVQALEVTRGPGLFWGVQYHPEFSLAEIASIIARLRRALAREKIFPSPEVAEAHADELAALEREARPELAERLGLAREVVEPALRRTELANFLVGPVRRTRAARGRGTREA